MGVRVIVDLRGDFGKIRDQNPRPTCMAFAASDAHSHARGTIDALSTEYAFFHAVHRTVARDPTQGVSFEIMSETIAVNGQPHETDWPYENKPVVLTTWKPPKTLGPIFRRKSSSIANGIDHICAQLASGKPVIVVMDISYSFFVANSTTEVLNAPLAEPRLNTHAVIAVGYGDNATDRCVLIRNSWGTNWFLGGYGWIDHRYLSPRVHVLGIMESTTS